METTGDETIQPNSSRKLESSGAGRRTGHAGTRGQTMNTARYPAGRSAPEEEAERPFTPVREVARKTEIPGTRYPFRKRQELPEDGEDDEEVRP